jgi:hypothetical protein
MACFYTIINKIYKNNFFLYMRDSVNKVALSLFNMQIQFILNYILIPHIEINLIPNHILKYESQKCSKDTKDLHLLQKKFKKLL